LGEHERRMTEDLIGMRATIAHEVVSGSSRILVEAVHGGQNMRSRLPR
jgi:hypothetical protein